MVRLRKVAWLLGLCTGISGLAGDGLRLENPATRPSCLEDRTGPRRPAPLVIHNTTGLDHEVTFGLLRGNQLVLTRPLGGHEGPMAELEAGVMSTCPVPARSVVTLILAAQADLQPLLFSLGPASAEDADGPALFRWAPREGHRGGLLLLSGGTEDAPTVFQIDPRMNRIVIFPRTGPLGPLRSFGRPSGQAVDPDRNAPGPPGQPGGQPPTEDAWVSWAGTSTWARP